MLPGPRTFARRAGSELTPRDSGTSPQPTFLSRRRSCRPVVLSEASDHKPVGKKEQTGLKTAPIPNSHGPVEVRQLFVAPARRSGRERRIGFKLHTCKMSKRSNTHRRRTRSRRDSGRLKYSPRVLSTVEITQRREASARHMLRLSANGTDSPPFLDSIVERTHAHHVANRVKILESPGNRNCRVPSRKLPSPLWTPPANVSLPSMACCTT